MTFQENFEYLSLFGGGRHPHKYSQNFEFMSLGQPIERFFLNAICQLFEGRQGDQGLFFQNLPNPYFTKMANFRDFLLISNSNIF